MAEQPDHLVDELLVLDAQAGSAEALGRLVGRWLTRFRRHARRFVVDADLADDVVQDAALAMVRAIGRLDDPARFRAWSYRILTRTAVNAVRRAQRERRLARHVAANSAKSPDAGGRNPAGAIDRVDRHAAVRRAVGQLDDEHRLVVELHYGDGLSVLDIAHVLGVRPGTIKSRLHHARRKLSAALSQHVELQR